MKSELELVAAANALAREFYAMKGYQVREDYKFYNATHPQERLCWQMACLAYEAIAGTDIEDCLEQIDIEDCLEQIDIEDCLEQIEES